MLAAGVGLVGCANPTGDKSYLFDKGYYVSEGKWITPKSSGKLPSIYSKHNPDNTCTIFLEDNISDNLVEVFSATVANLKQSNCTKTRVYLDSTGGRVDQAMAIGNIIRQNKYDTIVDGGMTCQSACTLIFIGGVNRAIYTNIFNNMLGTPTGKLGFHMTATRIHPSGPKTCSTMSHPDMINIFKYTNSMLGGGSAHMFMHWMAKADCNNMFFVNSDTLLHDRIATTSSYPRLY
jgi:hypothetical protein